MNRLFAAVLALPAFIGLIAAPVYAEGTFKIGRAQPLSPKVIARLLRPIRIHREFLFRTLRQRP